MSLASLAHKVESAGRGPDRNLVHMSPAELEHLRQTWGPPTINPQTGLPEYGWFDSLLQFAPAAIAGFGGGGGGFASQLGSLVGAEGPWSSILGSAIIGGAIPALTGGGVKGALTGALLGGGLSALSPVIGNALGGTDIGNWLGIGDTSRDTVFGNGAGRMGVDSVSGQPTDYMSQFFGGDAGSRTSSYASDAAFRSPAGALAGAATAAGAAGAGGASSGLGGSSLLKYALPLVALAGLTGSKGQTAGAPPPGTGTSNGGQLPKLSLDMRPKDTGAIDWYTYGQRPHGASFFDPQWKDAEGRALAADGGYVQGYAEGGPVQNGQQDQIARWLNDWRANHFQEDQPEPWLPDMRPRAMGDISDPQELARILGPMLGDANELRDASQKRDDPDSVVRPAELMGLLQSLGIANDPASVVRPGEMGMARGGALGALPSRYVGGGPGSGRDDMIDAKLSPNEYVVSASDVSDLGDGSPDEGARRLDAMRENLRKHKGSAMAKGKISPDAKRPEAYLPKGKTR